MRDDFTVEYTPAVTNIANTVSKSKVFSYIFWIWCTFW